MVHELPKLQYAADALKAVVSLQTIEIHHGKHHQAYVNNLNNLIVGTPFENATLETIVKEAEGGLYNNGAQVWNHTFYFEAFSANPKTAPTGQLLRLIESDFGTVSEFKEKFSKAAATLFGSGWVWLSLNNQGHLEISQESNAGNPLRKGLKPLLTCDVWEHAYYLDYQNRRPEYIQGFWSIIDWKIIEDRLD